MNVWNVSVDPSVPRDACSVSQCINVSGAVACSRSRRSLPAAPPPKGVTFKVKDYRIEGPARHKTMTMAPADFIRRFILHVLPKGFHRIRHYGLLASSAAKADTIARARQLIAETAPPQPPPPAKQHEATAGTEATDKPIHPCPCCGGRMIIIETFEAGSTPRTDRP